MLGKSTHLQLSCSKAPKRSKLAVTDIRQKPVDLFDKAAWPSTVALAIIFKIQVPLQKFSFLLTYTIPWDDILLLISCLHLPDCSHNF